MRERDLAIVVTCCVVVSACSVYAMVNNHTDELTINSVDTIVSTESSDEVESSVEQESVVESQKYYASSTTSSVSRTTNNFANGTGDKASIRVFTEEESDTDLELGEIDYTKEDAAVQYDEGEYTNESIASEIGNTIEFVTYLDQEFSGTYTSFIVTNLSSNRYDMNFTIYEDGEVLCSITDVSPGESESFDFGELLGNGEYIITVVSEAVNDNGYVLDSFEQDVDVTITDVIDDITEGTTKENQASGSTYETGIIYDAESMLCSVVLPAVLYVNKGDVGTDFDVSYRIVSVEKGTKFTLTAKNGLDSDSTVKLLSVDGGNGNVSSVSACVSMGESGTDLEYSVDASESILHTVGPIHFYMSNNKIASGDYYGTTRFRLEIEEASE